MAQDNDIPTDDNKQVEAGPGQRLKAARESRQMTIEQVASQLRMHARIIVALENDDYSELPGTTFVQGYLRSYSKLLELPEEVIVTSASAGRSEPELVRSISAGKIEASSSDLPFRLISLLIAVVVVIAVGWWLSQYEPVLEEQSPEVVLPGDEQHLQLPETTLSEQAGDEMEGETIIDGSALNDEEENGASVDEDILAADEESGVEQEPQAVVTPLELQTPTPPALTDSMPQSLLELAYQADSWSEISDASGRKLVYGLMPAGRNLKLRGEAPFNVFLGYASGVTVYYNGDLYDHSPFQRGDVARFRIGRAEHNRPLTGN